MIQSRRSFLRASSLMGLAATLSGKISTLAFGQQGTVLGSSFGFSVPKEALNDPLYKITRAMFTENLKTKFIFSLGPVRLTEMVLTAVNPVSSEGFKVNATSSRDSFSLVFQGPASLQLKANTYTVSHSKLGTFQLFIVPGLGDNTWRRYGADINRLNP